VGQNPGNESLPSGSGTLLYGKIIAHSAMGTVGFTAALSIWL